MQFGRDLAMIALGAFGVLAYQKYNEPVKDKVECMKDHAINKVTTVMDKASNAMDRTTDKLEKMK